MRTRPDECDAVCDRCRQPRDNCLRVPYDVTPPAFALDAVPSVDDCRVPWAMMCAGCRELREQFRARRARRA